MDGSIVVWGHVVPQPLLTIVGVSTRERITLVRRLLRQLRSEDPVDRRRVVAGRPAQRQISRLESCPMIWAANGLSVAMPSRTANREPARLTTRVLPEMPARPRDS